MENVRSLHFLLAKKNIFNSLSVIGLSIDPKFILIAIKTKTRTRRHQRTKSPSGAEAIVSVTVKCL